MEVSVVHQLLDAAFHRAQTCTVAFHYGVPEKDESIGTGTLISHRGSTYALTCHHVISKFAREPHGELILSSRHKTHSIARDRLKLVNSDARNDIALVEILGPLPTGIEPRDMSEFEVVQDFRSIKANRRGFAVIGFPRDYAHYNGPYSRTLQPLAYFTVDSSSKKQTRNALYLSYDEGLAPSKLPEPYGLSGSCVIAFDMIDRPNKRLFRYGRIVAIQTARGPRNKYLRCGGLKKLFEWLAA